MGIRGIGPTPDAAFAQAALAMTAMITDPARVEPREAVHLECEAASLDELFFDWIDALVFEMSTRRMLFGQFDVGIQDHHLGAGLWHLRARLRGEPVDRARHEPAVEIKGPTYTELRVSCDATTGEWIAQCVVDV